jgi:hypothetical protein
VVLIQGGKKGQLDLKILFIRQNSGHWQSFYNSQMLTAKMPPFFPK